MCFGKVLNPNATETIVSTVTPFKEEEQLIGLPSLDAQFTPESLDFEYWLLNNNFAPNATWGKDTGLDATLYPPCLVTDVSAFNPLTPDSMNDFVAPANTVVKEEPISPVSMESRSSDKTAEPKSKKRSSSDEEINSLVAKRQRNTEAARRSRQRKAMMMQNLEDEVKSLESEKSKLQVHLAILENEKKSWQSREAELNARVRELEAQLSESHRAMLSFTPAQK